MSEENKNSDKEATFIVTDVKINNLLMKKTDMSNVAQDIVINEVLLKGFPKQAGNDNSTGLSPEAFDRMMVYEIGHVLEGGTPRKRIEINPEAQADFDAQDIISGKIGHTGLTLQEALKGPEGQGNTESYKAAAKEIIKELGLKFVEPATLREKFTSTDKKDSNTPK